ncbi:hypothetical protein FHR24_000144 [Wenyingzhuangia heitensis]|uniref:Uncharacterized protein n=1 Tax=Wenyingzhuangia heitensis TaxID=1487859 RepID=A0ABX0U7I4_9FLAO|nr:hypothetical protein [Wenyingzhuangia heitensis]NIJ43705.1 hypothetical protein [Wenyingzhuangia heitensis]
MKRIVFFMVFSTQLIFSQEIKLKNNLGVGYLPKETASFYLDGNLYWLKGNQGIALGFSFITYKDHNTPIDYKSMNFLDSNKHPNDYLYPITLSYVKQIETFGKNQKIMLSLGGRCCIL